MDPFYPRLCVTPQERPCTVLRAARQRFYRAMLASHAGLQSEATSMGAD